jgi:hypothetical protein
MNVRAAMWAVVGLLLAPPSLHGAEKSAGDVLPVFILAGQSNMAGGGNAEELPDDLKAPQKDALFVQFWGSRWTPLSQKGRFGPEVGFDM